jgi:serine/threonine-protein kinase
VAYQHVREEPMPPSSVVSTVPPSLDAIVLMALRKAPTDRYQTCAEMRGDLMRVLGGQLPAAYRVEAGPQVYDGTRRSPQDTARSGSWLRRKPPKR